MKKPAAALLTAIFVSCAANPAPNEPVKPTPENLGTVADLTGAGSSAATSLQTLYTNFYSRAQTLITEANLNYVRLSDAGRGLEQLNAALNGTGARLVRPMADSNLRSALPTGDYNCRIDPNCTKTASSDLLIRFRTTSGLDGVITFDWDASSVGVASPTQTLTSAISNQTTYQQELPTKLYAKLEVNGIKFAEVNAAATWQSKMIYSNGSGADLNSNFQIGFSQATASGFINDTNGARAIELTNAQMSFDSTTNTAITNGNALVALNGDKATVKWNGTLRGSIDPEVANRSSYAGFAYGVPLYTPKGFLPSGETSAAVSLEFNGKLFAATAKVNNWTYNTDKYSLLSVDVLSGTTAALDGKTTSFVGQLNDLNRNCVLGDQLSVTTKAGVVTLESILTGAPFNAYRCNY